jgi:hypothetical protein
LENTASKWVISATGVLTKNALSEKSSAGKMQKKIFEQLEISKGYYLFAVVIFELNTNQENQKYLACG